MKVKVVIGFAVALLFLLVYTNPFRRVAKSGELLRSESQVSSPQNTSGDLSLNLPISLHDLETLSKEEVYSILRKARQGKTPESIKILTLLMENKEQWVQIEALNVLSEYGPQEALEPILNKISQTSPPLIKRGALMALGGIAEHNNSSELQEKSAPILKRTLEELRDDPSRESRGTYFVAVETLGKVSGPLAADLIKDELEQVQEDDVRLYSLVKQMKMPLNEDQKMSLRIILEQLQRQPAAQDKEIRSDVLRLISERLNP